MTFIIMNKTAAESHRVLEKVLASKLYLSKSIGSGLRDSRPVILTWKTRNDLNSQKV